jgi:hypothetical protein
MSLKMHDLSLEKVVKLIMEHKMSPSFAGQNPYIGSGPFYEMLACLMANGFYQVELLDKEEIEESLQHTIKAFSDYTEAAKS